MPIPAIVRTNAWTGEPNATPVAGGFGPERLAWSLAEAGRRVRKDLKPTVPDPADWRDPRVGWGVVLPARPGATPTQLASGSDAPEPIQRLIAARSDQATGRWRVPVLRYHPEADPGVRFRFLQNHRTGKSLQIVGSGTGVADHEIPSYLLIAAPPSEVPWELQYILSAQRLVGRLDLDEEGLGHYVDALLADFAGAEADVRRSVTWAVVHDDPDDITHTLRRMITRKLHRRLAEDEDLAPGARFLDGAEEPATAATLIAALAGDRPGLVVTSSHGKTGPLATPQMAAELGLPVDQAFATLAPDVLVADWAPSGAIWLAHACCSAGSAKRSAYDGLFDPAGSIGKLLAGVAALGDTVAPLPKRLLGHRKPLRAFIGQVEPTFDYTLQEPATGQPLTNTLCDTIFPRLLLPLPVGLALDPWNDQVDGYNRTWLTARDRFNELPAADGVENALLQPRLAAQDVASTVVLGDPTATLPPL